MRRAVPSQPMFVTMMAVVAVAMVPPALVAWIERDFHTARAFFYNAILVGVLTGLIGIATRSTRKQNGARNQLLTLLGAYTVLPLLCALPVHVAVAQAPFGKAWLDMISAATTTGGAVFEYWYAVPRAVHLWRAEVAWMGGFLVWVSAIAVLAPLNLGGFEVRTPLSPDQAARGYLAAEDLVDARHRVRRHAADLAPIYCGLTFVLWLGLLIAGDDELVALTHAMSVLSTSGISAVGGMANARSAMVGEAVVILFFVFALSRVTFSHITFGASKSTRRDDPELRWGIALIGLATAVLFLRHWIGEGGPEASLLQGLKALWGTLFTVASFLTTTGFESRYWGLAAEWTGLSSPGLALIGLSVIGGGVATTAGGVKLMRVFALSQHMRQEVHQLVTPHAVSGGGAQMRKMRGPGAYIAWILFMLFAVSIAAIMTLLSLDGVQFETAMVLTVAALANCGPLSLVAGEIPVSFSEVPAISQAVLAVAMVVGRLESLALIALFNPELWRK